MLERVISMYERAIDALDRVEALDTTGIIEDAMKYEPDGKARKAFVLITRGDLEGHPKSEETPEGLLRYEHLIGHLEGHYSSSGKEPRRYQKAKEQILNLKRTYDDVRRIIAVGEHIPLEIDVEGYGVYSGDDAERFTAVSLKPEYRQHLKRLLQAIKEVQVGLNEPGK